MKGAGMLVGNPKGDHLGRGTTFFFTPKSDHFEL